jgi:hypothetical protein
MLAAAMIPLSDTEGWEGDGDVVQEVSWERYVRAALLTVVVVAVTILIGMWPRVPEKEDREVQVDTFRVRQFGRFTREQLIGACKVRGLAQDGGKEELCERLGDYEHLLVHPPDMVEQAILHRIQRDGNIELSELFWQNRWAARWVAAQVGEGTDSESPDDVVERHASISSWTSLLSSSTIHDI